MPRLDHDLPALDVAALAARAPALSDASNRPIPDAIAKGDAVVSPTGVQMKSLAASATSVGIASAIAGLGPRDLRVDVAARRYAVHARLNPWIIVANGRITRVDHGPKNKGGMNPPWQWVYTNDLRTAGINPSNPVGQLWPPTSSSSSTGAAQYSIPSATFTNAGPRSATFNALAPDQRPPLPPGHAYINNGGTVGVYRDPNVAPNSPGFDITEDVLPQGSAFRSHINDPQAPSGQMLLGVNAPVMTLPNALPRSYPMTSQNFRHGTTGITLGRGHAIDHRDGNAVTTSSRNNYTPQNTNWNEGARNSNVAALRREGGGNYQEQYTYANPPARTVDNTPIPQANITRFTNLSGQSHAYNIPTDTYSGRRQADAQPYQIPANTYPTPKYY